MKEEVGRMKGETGGAEDAEGKAGHSRVCETGRQGDQMGEDGRGCFAGCGSQPLKGGLAAGFHDMLAFVKLSDDS